ncbi:mitogen-activated protein kinase kinase kinase 18-like [Neltuma alba]|uniref:mitogen-activated protein kinase kinase kinase 18-like n=1 Tax=Neltuma alba TaxID=207710 RepID=UPI0010A36B59|nr:mitogen-activated protein kinase kinase kinase 18-like [Prosopis alba]
MDWSRGHILGCGSSATVSLASSSRSDLVFAVKSSGLSRSQFLQREQSILSTVSSPYIVAYKGCDVSRENNQLFYNLFMEYMPFGTVLQAVQRHGGRLDLGLVGFYTWQILQGLEYLHSNKLAHCDIKSTNILIGEDGAKISDFGCAKRVDDTAAPISGTPMFMAPEVARGDEQGYAGDIWALGCTVIEMATGDSPWPNMSDPFSVLHRIAYAGETPEIPGSLPEEAKDFLDKCLRRNPTERWTATQLLKHPFVTEFNSKSIEKEIEKLNSSSPTCVLEQGFWNSMEEPETHGNLIRTRFENSASDRIRRLAEFSGEPRLTSDDNWVTIRGIDETSASTSDDDLEESVKSNVRSSRISGCFTGNYEFSEISDMISTHYNFERGTVNRVIQASMSAYS